MKYRRGGKSIAKCFLLQKAGLEVDLRAGVQIVVEFFFHCRMGRQTLCEWGRQDNPMEVRRLNSLHGAIEF